MTQRVDIDTMVVASTEASVDEVGASSATAEPAAPAATTSAPASAAAPAASTAPAAPAAPAAKAGAPGSQTAHLKRRFGATLFSILVALLVAGTFTYAWYVFNANRHITDVKMAAGTGVTFLISNSYETGYRTSTGLEFSGLLNPVSTDQIRHTTVDGVAKGGFQKVLGFTTGVDTQSKLWANLFGPADRSDFYMSTLYLATGANADMDVYLADILYTDKDEQNPISSALRIGFVVHDPGRDKNETSEYIFEVSDLRNPKADYNTLDGYDGCVLDSSKTDGQTVPFKPYTSANYCLYDDDANEVSLKPASVKICTLPAAGSGESHGTPVQVDVYVWLEGCDADCTNNLCSTSLDSIALRFGGIKVAG